MDSAKPERRRTCVQRGRGVRGRAQADENEARAEQDRDPTGREINVSRFDPEHGAQCSQPPPWLHGLEQEQQAKKTPTTWSGWEAHLLSHI